MLDIKKVDNIDFGKIDMLSGEVGKLINFAATGGSMYAIKFNTQFNNYYKDEDYIEKISVFKLSDYKPEGSEFREFKGKDFPIQFDISEYQVDYDLIIDENGSIDLKESEKELLSEDDVINHIYTTYIGEHQVENFIGRYLDINNFFRFNLENYFNIDDTIALNGYSIVFKSMDLKSGALDFKFNIDKDKICNFEYLIILPKKTNVSPIIYGYLSIGEDIYRVATGNYSTDIPLE